MTEVPAEVNTPFTIPELRLALFEKARREGRFSGHTDTQLWVLVVSVVDMSFKTQFIDQHPFFQARVVAQRNQMQLRVVK